MAEDAQRCARFECPFKLLLEYPVQVAARGGKIDLRDAPILRAGSRRR